MKILKEYNVTELNPSQLKNYSGGAWPWWVYAAISYVVSEIIDGIDDAYTRGCLKQQ